MIVEFAWGLAWIAIQKTSSNLAKKWHESELKSIAQAFEQLEKLQPDELVLDTATSPTL